MKASALAAFALVLAGCASPRFEHVVDLTHTLDSAFPYIPVPGITFPFGLEPIATLEANGVAANRWRIHEHLGTRIDAPNHFARGGRSLEQIRRDELVIPVIVIDISARAATASRFMTDDEVHMSPRKETRKPSKGTASAKSSKGFTDEERAAMKERAKELKAETDKADGESALLAKIAEMPGPDRAMAKRLHAIVTASAPALSPKTWYGMPAYARGDKVVCFFQSAAKFKSRYATFGFSDQANLDEGAMWPTAFALKELTAAEEARIGALVKKAAG